ncbi:MAG: hypothetical protein ACNA77_04410 [Opitutales bacterium]
MTDHVVTVAARYLDPAALHFPQRILVSLKPPEYVDFEGEYSLRFAPRGFVNLDIRWEAGTSLLTTSQALSEALLLRYSIFNYGHSGPGFLPKWPATAIGTRAYLMLRPAQSQLLSDWTELSATPTVVSLLRRKWNEPSDEINAYLFLLALEETMERRAVRELMGQSIAGANIASLLAERLPPPTPEAEPLGLDEWWRISFINLQAPQEGATETMVISRAWIESLADFSGPELKGLNLARLWNERENTELRDLIEARYEIIKLRIARVNPGYFNAARSLGALFESYLMGEHRHRYIFNLSVFLGDFEDGKAVEARVIEALSSAGTR